MKKYLFIFLSFLLSVNLPGQSYSFQDTAATFSFLANPADTLNGTDPWDDSFYTVTLPFTFLNYNKLTIGTNGLAGFTDMSTLTGPDTTLTLFAFGGNNGRGADLTDRGKNLNISKSPITWESAGTAPNRIFKVEWKNAGFYWDTAYSYRDSISFQLWLYETSEKVEFYYGYSRVNPGNYRPFGSSSGPVIGIGYYNFFEDSFLNVAPKVLLTGYINNPTTSTDPDAITVGSGVLSPDTNKVFRFIPVLTGLHSYNTIEDLKIFPNPAKNFMNVSFEAEGETSVSVYSTTGQEMLKQNFQGAGSVERRLNLDNLAPGLYIINIRTGRKAGAGLVEVE